MMVGGLAWLFHKNINRNVEPIGETQVIHMEGYRNSLSGFLERFHPGAKLFISMDRNHWEVWLPEDPGRKIAETACDAAWEKNR